MILLAPLLGAVVLDRWGPAALFAVAAGSAGLSFGLLLALRLGVGPAMRVAVAKRQRRSAPLL